MAEISSDMNQDFTSICLDGVFSLTLHAGAKIHLYSFSGTGCVSDIPLVLSMFPVDMLFDTVSCEDMQCKTTARSLSS